MKTREKEREKEIDDWAAAKKADLKKQHSNGNPTNTPMMMKKMKMK